MESPKDEDVSLLFQRALERHRSEAFEEAAALYRAVLGKAPGHIAANANLGAALRDLGRAAEALPYYDAALAERPDHAPTWNNRGVALIDLGRHAEAEAAFDRAVSLRPDFAAAVNNKGRVLAMLGRSPSSAGAPAAEAPRVQQALAAFDRAIALYPGYAAAYDNKGLLLFELGRFDEAREAFEQAIRLAPDTVRFYYHLAELRPLEPHDPELAALKALTDYPGRLSEGDQILAHFALGAVHDRLGEPAMAFEHWRQGAALRRAQLAYDEGEALAQMERIRDAFSAEMMQAAASAAPGPPGPVFIVGMPRSGSTLVEQILASHPDVVATGETDAFRRALRAVSGEAPERAASLSAAALQALGAEYLRLTSDASGRRMVDKRLDNFLLAGLIALALPNARIVHVRRDPRDCCLSCFSKLFGDDLPQTFDLGELGRYYRGYDALMAHWRAVLPPGTLIEVQYEALVDDLEGQTRRLLAHCGLAWNGRCLDFHLTQRRIPTASATQVRRAVYPNAVGRWRRYEPWLGPLLAALSG
jgi:Flp pilus assembly protein TadD